MAGVWRVLVLVAGLAAMASVAQRQKSHREIATQALQSINDGQPQGQPLFRLLDVIPLPSPDPNTKQLQFRIKETVCLAGQPRRRPRQCAFRNGGEERTCTTSFSTSESARAHGLSCSPSNKVSHCLGPQFPHLENGANVIVLSASGQVTQRKNSAASPVAAASEVDLSKLPPQARDIYEKAKYDILSGILRNF
ncbi:15 kDa protein B-like [Rhynchonycteris naso]